MRDMALSKALRSLRSGKEQDEGQGGGKRAPVAEITSQVADQDPVFVPSEAFLGLDFNDDDLFQIDDDFLDFSDVTQPQPATMSTELISVTTSRPAITTCTTNVGIESSIEVTHDIKVGVSPSLPHGGDQASNQSLQKLRSFQFVKRTDPARQRSAPESWPAVSSDPHSLDQASAISPCANQERSTSDTPSSLSAHVPGAMKAGFGVGSSHRQETPFSRENQGRVPQTANISQLTIPVLNNHAPTSTAGCTPVGDMRISKRPLVPSGSDSMHVSSAGGSRKNTSLPSTPVSRVPASILASTPSTTPTAISTPTSHVLVPMTTPTSNRHVTHTPVSLRYPTSGTTPTTFSAKRKFPGPAGILPKLAPGQSMDSVRIAQPASPAPCSTPRAKRFTRTTPRMTDEQMDLFDGRQEFLQGPWIEMLKDLDMDGDPSTSHLLEYTIASALTQAQTHKLEKGKIKHLRVLLKSIVPAGRSASAVLRDPTGEVLATVHNRVLEEHRDELQPGCAVILRQVSVIRPSSRTHYLNVTPSNIVRIYSHGDCHKPVQINPEKIPRLSTEMEDNDKREVDIAPLLQTIRRGASVEGSQRRSIVRRPPYVATQEMSTIPVSHSRTTQPTDHPTPKGSTASSITSHTSMDPHTSEDEFDSFFDNLDSSCLDF